MVPFHCFSCAYVLRDLVLVQVPSSRKQLYLHFPRLDCPLGRLQSPGCQYFFHPFTNGRLLQLLSTWFGGRLHF